MARYQLGKSIINRIFSYEHSERARPTRIGRLSQLADSRVNTISNTFLRYIRIDALIRYTYATSLSFYALSNRLPNVSSSGATFGVWLARSPSSLPHRFYVDFYGRLHIYSGQLSGWRPSGQMRLHFWLEGGLQSRGWQGRRGRELVRLV